ncbi:MAG: hypothetical protein IT463_12225, partial [Planctomycetes bacterium]|nr:hypothetical protein [Planctomycetota bacterium]
PPAMFYHSAVFDTTPGAPRMIVYGGYTSTAHAGLYQLDLLTNQWAQLGGTIAQPQERWSHGAAWDAPDNRMVVVGGYLNGEVAATQESGTVAEVWFFGG